MLCKPVSYIKQKNWTLPLGERGGGGNKCLKTESREWRTVWGPGSPQTTPQRGWQKASDTRGAPVNLKGSSGSVLDAYVRMFCLGIILNVFTWFCLPEWLKIVGKEGIPWQKEGSCLQKCVSTSWKCFAVIDQASCYAMSVKFIRAFHLKSPLHKWISWDQNCTKMGWFDQSRKEGFSTSDFLIELF